MGTQSSHPTLTPCPKGYPKYDVKLLDFIENKKFEIVIDSRRNIVI
jgi:hypothetical protein